MHNLTNLYKSAVESILANSISEFGNSTVQDRKALQHVIKNQHRSSVEPLSPHCRTSTSPGSQAELKTSSGTETHPQHYLFSLLPSGSHYKKQGLTDKKRFLGYQDFKLSVTLSVFFNARDQHVFLNLLFLCDFKQNKRKVLSGACWVQILLLFFLLLFWSFFSFYPISLFFHLSTTVSSYLEGSRCRPFKCLLKNNLLRCIYPNNPQGQLWNQLHLLLSLRFSVASVSPCRFARRSPVVVLELLQSQTKGIGNVNISSI